MMNIKLTVCLLLFALAAGTGIGAGASSLYVSESASAQQAGGQDAQAQEDDALPLFVRYGILFRRLAGSQPLRQEAPAAPAIGKKRDSHYRALLQREAQLSDGQARSLFEIAGECQRRIAVLDGRAREIIEASRAQHPRGRLAPGEPLPTPPPELKALQEERRSTILQAREQLHAAFGDEAFERFERYIASEGNGRAFMLPPPDRPPISLQWTATALAADGVTAKKQFHTGERILVRIELQNNSTRSISVRQVDLYDWFELLRIEGNSRNEIFVRPPDKKQDSATARERQQTPDIELAPGQKTIVGTLDLSGSIKTLKPGRYVFAPHPHTLLNRPPDKSEFLDFNDAGDALTFEIVQP